MAGRQWAKLVAEKTKLVFLTRKQKKSFDNIQTMDMRRKRVESKEAIKYLGITLDRKVAFREHFRRAVDNAAAVKVKLGRLMANIGGPKTSKRRL